MLDSDDPTPKLLVRMLAPPEEGALPLPAPGAMAKHQDCLPRDAVDTPTP